MKRLLGIPVVLAALANAEPPPIEIPAPLPVETTTQAPAEASAALPISNTQRDPQDGTKRLYENRITKIQVRVPASWAIMEFKESEQSGTVSFTISRLPLVTFAVVRAPLEGAFDEYVSVEALTPLYPAIRQRTPTTFAGRKGILIRGVTEDGRLDESHFSHDGKSFYRVSFSAPEDAWAEAEKSFHEIKRTMRWLN